MAGGESGRKSRAGASLPDIPDKLYFRIGEVARLLALPAHVLRFWESEFPHLRPYKGGTGQRLYRRRDVEALLEIRRLLYDRGYTISGARQLLTERAPDMESTARTAEPIAPGNSAQVSGNALLNVYTGLRELSQLLSRPAQSDAKSRHNGLPLALRRRTAVDTGTPSLFGPSFKQEPEDTH